MLLTGFFLERPCPETPRETLPPMIKHGNTWQHHIAFQCPKNQVPKDKMPCGCLPWLKMGKGMDHTQATQPWSARIRSQFPEGPERQAEDEDPSICLVMGPLLLSTVPPVMTSNLAEGRTSPPHPAPWHCLFTCSFHSLWLRALRSGAWTPLWLCQL